MKEAMCKLLFFTIITISGNIYSQSFNTTMYKAELNSISLGIREKAETKLVIIDTISVKAKEKAEPISINDSEEIPIENVEYTSKATSFSLPLERLTINSTFGARKHPVNGKWHNHNGIDFKANYEGVKSVLNGVIVASGWSKINGNYLAIKTNNYVLYYLHLEEYYYKTNEIVKAGEVIAVSGNTGRSTAPHLHFAVKRENKWINPVTFLTDLNNIYSK